MKKKKISIAFVNHTFLPETYGGAEKQTLRLNLDLQTKNHYKGVLQGCQSHLLPDNQCLMDYCERNQFTFYYLK